MTALNKWALEQIVSGRKPATVVKMLNGDAAMSAFLHRLGFNATVHGMRWAFSTWAHEQTAHSNQLIEMALAHSVGTDVKKTHRRSDLSGKRRKLMEQWATYCCSPPPAGALVPLHKGASA